jgi:hypothetical protein
MEIPSYVLTKIHPITDEISSLCPIGSKVRSVAMRVNKRSAEWCSELDRFLRKTGA